MLSEREIIRVIRSKLQHAKGYDLDDVDVVDLDGLSIALKCDMLVESTDVPRGMKPWQVARKSIVACVSDMASKGVKPLYALISLALPSTVSTGYVRSLAYGFRKAEDEFGIRIIGGDTNEGREVVIDCCMLGICKKGYVRRSGARTDDLIVTSGIFGYTKAGLMLLHNELKANKWFKARAVRSVLMPKPRLEFGLSLLDYATSSMDSSDGLANTLHAMSKASKKMFIIDELPISSDLKRFADDNMIDVNDLALYGGEEYEIVATISKDTLDKVSALASVHGCDLRIIGKVSEGSGVMLKHDNKLVEVEDKGWEHFKGE